MADPWVNQQIRIQSNASDGSMSSYPTTPADLSLTFIQDMYQRNAELTSIIHQLSPLLQGTQPTMTPQPHPARTSATPASIPEDLNPSRPSLSLLPNPATTAFREGDSPTRPGGDTIHSSQQSVVTSSSGVTNPSPPQDYPLLPVTL